MVDELWRRIAEINARYNEASSEWMGASPEEKQAIISIQEECDRETKHIHRQMRGARIADDIERKCPALFEALVLTVRQEIVNALV